MTTNKTQIATFDHNLKAVKLSSCGWQTNTTKTRLNAILDEVKWGCKVFQKNFDWVVSYNNQTRDFFDGMILVDANHLEVAYQTTSFFLPLIITNSLCLLYSQNQISSQKLILKLIK